MMDTKVRDNVDLFITLRTRSESSRKAIWESYLSDLPAKDAVKLQQTWCWKDNKTGVSQCLVVLNRMGGNTVQERVRAFIACNPGPFIIGSPSMWGEDSDDEEDEEEEEEE